MTTALYRRYRPQDFSEVIGQEHVTEPLMQALRSGRIGHAYLFSGPRGCGKTTSARILARCLNCEQGPTPTPCGECDSCRALATGGTGSVDVIEIDAASHGGVDDARDLREKAAYGPAQSRYKVYIIDEAHMVTPQGFNALLKIVEEPPEHVKFVFATTEPEKVIGTIRSRTHHYPFRLVPPARLQDYLEALCERENVQVEPGVLSFVVRAGGGSVRDSLSVLDQLIAGSDEAGLTYAGAAALLGFTEGELLDACVDALAAGDGAGVFRQVDRVVETGQDPRRFVEDLLERFRDLIVLAAVSHSPDAETATSAVLRGIPGDQLARMRVQAGAFGPGQLSYAADVINAGLTEMTGATSPRLQLELLCARLLLPSGAGEQGHAARLDRLERRLDVGGGIAAPIPDQRADSAPPQSSPRAEAATVPPTPTPGHDAWAADEQTSERRRPETAGQGDGRGDAAGRDEKAGVVGSGRRSGHSRDRRPEPEAQPGRPRTDERGQAGSPDATQTQQAPADAGHATGGGQHPHTPAGPGPDVAPPERAAAGGAPAGRGPRGGVDTEMIRRNWPDVLQRIFNIRRVTWTFLSEHAQVLDYDGTRLLLGLSTKGLATTFRNGPHSEVVRQALSEALGIDTRVEGIPASDAPAARGGQGGHPGGPPGPMGPGGPPPSRGPRPDGPGTPPSRDGGHTGQPPRGDRPGPDDRRARGAADAASGGRPERDRPRSHGGADGRSPFDDDRPPPSDDDIPPDEESLPPDPGPAFGAGRRPGRGTAEDDGRSAAHPGSRPDGQGGDERPTRGAADGTPTGQDKAHVPTPMRSAHAGAAQAREALRAARSRPAAPAPTDTGGAARTANHDDEVSVDDEDIADAGAVGQPVIASVLGGVVIAEEDG